VISTIKRPSSTPPISGTHIDTRLFADEGEIYPDEQPFWVSISHLQCGAATIESEAEPTYFRFYEYVTGSSAAEIVLVDDLSERNPTDTEFESEYQRVIDELRDGDRELAANELIAILRNSQEDHEEPEVKLFSLQSMAHFLISNGEYRDPIIGPDPTGIMQIEWHIDGNGLLVMAFLEDNEVHFVAQADETSNRLALDYSVQLPVNQILEGYGYLVPTR
jgi:hypothetical protein